jgi:hypothetical protein
MDWYKAPSNYHLPSDRPENLDRASVSAAARLALAFLRDLDASARCSAAPQPRARAAVPPG